MKNNVRLSKAEKEELDSWLDEDYNDPKLSKLLSNFKSRGEWDD